MDLSFQGTGLVRFVDVFQIGATRVSRRKIYWSFVLASELDQIVSQRATIGAEVRVTSCPAEMSDGSI